MILTYNGIAWRGSDCALKGHCKIQILLPSWYISHVNQIIHSQRNILPFVRRIMQIVVFCINRDRSCYFGALLKPQSTLHQIFIDLVCDLMSVKGEHFDNGVSLILHSFIYLHTSLFYTFY